MHKDRVFLTALLPFSIREAKDGGKVDFCFVSHVREKVKKWGGDSQYETREWQLFLMNHSHVLKNMILHMQCATVAANICGILQDLLQRL